MYVVDYTKSECCCPSWGVEICMQPDSEHLELDLRNANCICSCHRFINFSSWMPVSLKYADIKMYVLKITFNALGTAQTTTQGWNHAKSHESRDARRFCMSPILSEKYNYSQQLQVLSFIERLRQNRVKRGGVDRSTHHIPAMIDGTLVA
jgi:hypothetical protein